MRLAFIAAAALLALSATAQAQYVHTPAITPNLRPLPIVLPHVTGASMALVTASHDSVTTAPDHPLAPVSALSAFRLNFEDGDHRLRQMAVLPEAALVRFTLDDQTPVRPFAARAAWINITGGQAQTVTAGGGGVVTIPIAAGPANSTFALRGFEFRRRNVDANVRAVSINLSPDGHSILASLTDDARADFRINNGGPCVGCDRQRQFAITVQYAWIPNALVVGQGSITGNEFGREAAQAPANSVIRGFSFNFLNSDHFLAHFEVDLANNGGLGRYQDVNAGDPMRWQVDYATLRPAS